jgi:hypothetical protein
MCVHAHPPPRRPPPVTSAAALVFGFLVPTLVCGLGWGDYRGGFFIAGVARLVFVHHSTFFVNSLAHYWGDSAFSDGHTAKNSVVTAVLTIGEGYHNFHHEVRHAVQWFAFARGAEPTVGLRSPVCVHFRRHPGALHTRPSSRVGHGGTEPHKTAPWGPRRPQGA